MLERVEFSRWATLIVPVPKSYGTFRLCGEYKVTLNAALEVGQYPKPEEIFVSLAGGQPSPFLTYHKRTSNWSWMTPPRSW